MSRSKRLTVLLKRLVGGLLTLSGGLFLLVVAVLLFDTETEEYDVQSARIGGLMIGIPQVIAGSALLHSSFEAKRLESRLATADKTRDLLQTFYGLLAESEGNCTPLQLAIAARIPLADAEVFLDNQAKLLDADFEATEQGTLIYRFPVT